MAIGPPAWCSATDTCRQWEDRRLAIMRQIPIEGSFGIDLKLANICNNVADAQENSDGLSIVPMFE